MILKLTRFDSSFDGTDGLIQMPSGLKIFTLERPWLNNESNKSCIPIGTYSCVKTRSPRFGETYEVRNVTNRSNILIHSGNTMSDTHGCILLGLCSFKVHGFDTISSSRQAFKQFMLELYKHDEFTLEIVDEKHT